MLTQREPFSKAVYRICFQPGTHGLVPSPPRTAGGSGGGKRSVVGCLGVAMATQVRDGTREEYRLIARSIIGYGVDMLYILR